MQEAHAATLLLSDLHAQFDVVDAQVVHAEHEVGVPVGRVVVLGDFGFFAPQLRRWFRRERRRFARPVAFLEGNHEDFRDFHRLVERYADVVTWLPRASLQPLGPWRSLCIGGARYMDSWSTPPGSEITGGDIAACLAHAPGTVDVVLSHDCPSGIGVPGEAAFAHLGPPGHDGLAEVAAHLRPRWWFFGHHHRWHEHERDGTQFVGLPLSHSGYVLLDRDTGLRRIEHEVPLAPPPRWRRLLGLR